MTVARPMQNGKIYYLLHRSHHLTAVTLSQDIVDFDRRKGYAAKPGYIENCWKIFRGEKEPIRSGFTVRQGHRLDNFVHGDIVYQYFLSCHFADILAAEDITGYRAREEDVKNADGTPLCYKRLIVTGRCGITKRLDEFQVTKPWAYSCESLPDEGVDFFLPSNYGSFFCTERVARLIKKHKLRVSTSPVEFV